MALMKDLKAIKQTASNSKKVNEHFCEQVYLSDIKVLYLSKAATLFSTSLIHFNEET